MIVEILLFLLFATTGLLAVLVVGIFFSHLRKGPSTTSDLMANGFGVKEWLTGDMPSPKQSTSIDVIEGIEFEFDGDEVYEARQTRTVSAET